MKKNLKTIVATLAVILCSVLAFTLFGCTDASPETTYKTPQLTEGNSFTFDKRLSEDVSVAVDWDFVSFESLSCDGKELTEQDFKMYSDEILILAAFFQDNLAGDELNFTLKTKGGNLEFSVSVIRSEHPLKPTINKNQAEFDLFLPEDIVIEVDDKGAAQTTVYNGDNPMNDFTYVGGVLTFPAQTFTAAQNGGAFNLRIVTEYGECPLVITITNSAPAFETFTIKGKVTDSEGNPIGSISVKTEDKETVTAADGTYTFTGLKVWSAPYEIVSEGFPYLSGKTEVTKEMIKSSDGTVSLSDLALTKGTVTYKLHIYDTFGEPLNGVKVTEGDTVVNTLADGIAQFQGIELDRDVIFGLFKDGYRDGTLSCMADDVHSFLIEKDIVMHGGKQLYFGNTRPDNGIYAKGRQEINKDANFANFTFFSQQSLSENEFVAIFLYNNDVVNDKIVYKIFGDGSVYKSTDALLKRAEMGEKIAASEMRDHCGGKLFSLKIDYADISSDSVFTLRFTLSKGADGAACAEFSGSELKVYDPSSGASYGSGGTYDNLSSYMGLDRYGYYTALISAVGTVLHEGAPVKDAKVTLYGQTETTDEQGRFKFTKIPRDFSSTSLRITKAGYNEIYISGSIQGINRDESVGNLTNKESDHLEMTLQKIVFKGIVEDRNFKPVAGATVRLKDRSVLTDAEGKFEFKDVFTIDGVTLTVDGFELFFNKKIVSEQSYSAEDFILDYNGAKYIIVFHGTVEFRFYAADAVTHDDVHEPNVVVKNNKTGEVYTTATGKYNGFVEFGLRYEEMPTEGFTVTVSHDNYETASFIISRDDFKNGNTSLNESIKMTPKAQ